MLIGKPESQRNFDPAPQGGKALTLCDVVDLGEVETDWGAKDMLRLHYITPDTFQNDDGDAQHFMVVERCTKSLYDGSGKSPNPSKLYTRITSLTGAGPQYNSDGQFDVETLLGKSAFANIVHSEPNDKGAVWANIQSMMPLPAEIAAPLIPTNFVRSKDREPKPDQQQQKRDDWATGNKDGEPQGIEEPTWASEELPL